MARGQNRFQRSCAPPAELGIDSGDAELEGTDRVSLYVSDAERKTETKESVICISVWVGGRGGCVCLAISVT